EETDWNEAPILSDRSLGRRIKGRLYSLYYNGPHLHMVVVRRGKATYWVVNSLLDELSNETMLAIAKGLKPINAVSWGPAWRMGIVRPVVAEPGKRIAVF